jgi:uncharacterized protein (TIGR02246 family)
MELTEKEQQIMKLGAITVLACVIALAGTHPAIAQTGTVKSAIAASNKKFSEALAAGNAAGVAALHTEDAVLMPPNTEAVKGRPAIEKLFTAFVAAGIKGVTLTSQEVEAHGDTATELGAYSIKDATGKEVDRGKYIVLWKRVKGDWKLHRDIWNSSMPLPAPK